MKVANVMITSTYPVKVNAHLDANSVAGCGW
jgi:hypothetical protein